MDFFQLRKKVDSARNDHQAMKFNNVCNELCVDPNIGMSLSDFEHFVYQKFGFECRDELQRFLARCTATERKCLNYSVPSLPLAATAKPVQQNNCKISNRQDKRNHRANSTLGKLACGDRALITGLAQREDLNGCTCCLQMYLAEKDRWQVQLLRDIDGEPTVLGVRPANLSKIIAAPEDNSEEARLIKEVFQALGNGSNLIATALQPLMEFSLRKRDLDPDYLDYYVVLFHRTCTTFGVDPKLGLGLSGFEHYVHQKVGEYYVHEKVGGHRMAELREFLRTFVVTERNHHKKSRCVPGSQTAEAAKSVRQATPKTLDNKMMKSQGAKRESPAFFLCSACAQYQELGEI